MCKEACSSILIYRAQALINKSILIYCKEANRQSYVTWQSLNSYQTRLIDYKLWDSN